MINAQPPIFTAVSAHLKAKFTAIKVTGEISDTESVFPCVMIEETGNTPINQDNGETSYFAALQYRVVAWSNKSAGKMADARLLIAAVDEVLEPLNFRRKSFVPQSGLYSNSVYRITATYEAMIDETGTIYRR